MLCLNLDTKLKTLLIKNFFTCHTFLNIVVINRCQTQTVVFPSVFGTSKNLTVVKLRLFLNLNLQFFFFC